VVRGLVRGRALFALLRLAIAGQLDVAVAQAPRREAIERPLGRTAAFGESNIRRFVFDESANVVIRRLDAYRWRLWQPLAQPVLAFLDAPLAFRQAGQQFGRVVLLIAAHVAPPCWA